jgi:predicted dienelactone hydrolase
VAVLAGSDCGSADKRSADFAGDGTYGVGSHTFTFVDTTRATPANGPGYAGEPTRTLTVSVWYPVANGQDGPDAMLARGGPFPLVVHSHGFHDDRGGETYLGEHLATHGYVVAAPSFPLSRGMAPGDGPTISDTPNQPLDVRFVIDQLIHASSSGTAPIGGAIDRRRIGASGLSLGALTTLLVTFQKSKRDPRIQAALSLAAPSCMLTPEFFATAHVPLLFVHGDADLVVPVHENSIRAFGDAQHPRELILLSRGSHTAFTGLATTFDPHKNYDRLGCQFVEGINVQSFDGLGAPGDGINSDASVCPPPCQAPPVDPPLGADRQQELTKIIALAFFDSTLKGDGAAGRFLQTRVAAENPELSLQMQ